MWQLPHCVTPLGLGCVQGRDVGWRPEILMGAVTVLCFSSVDVLQANSGERAVQPAVGILPVLPVQLLSVACGC